MSHWSRREFLASVEGGVAAASLAPRETPPRRGPMKARDLNAYLRSRVLVDEPSVDRIVIGDPEAVVKRAGTAWMPYWKTCREAVAAGVNVLVVHEPADLAPDLFVGIDDTMRTWIQTTWAEETGHPLVVVNHGTSEEAGMRALSDHLREAFPDRGVAHFPQGCGYRWIA